MVPFERLSELLSYDASSGVLTWKVDRGGRGRRGAIAGWRDTNGYIKVSIDGKAYKAHQIAYVLVHGKWPESHIDHMDGRRDNNCARNLRQASRAANAQNQKRPHANNACGYLGVNWSASHKRWVAKLSLSGKRYFCGYHDTPEEAHRAYLDLKRRLHPGFVESA